MIPVEARSDMIVPRAMRLKRRVGHREIRFRKRSGASGLSCIPEKLLTAAGLAPTRTCSAVCRFLAIVEPPFQIQNPHGPNIYGLDPSRGGRSLPYGPK